MKNIFLFAPFLSVILLCSYSKKHVPILSFNWEIDVNKIDSNYYENTITLVNNGNEPLGSDWVIYFSQFSKKYELDPKSPIAIEQINGTYHKIYPTSFYKAIDAGASLSIVLRSKRRTANESFLPEGAYWVRKFKNGKESTPENITINIKRGSDLFKLPKVDGKEDYYPFGNKLYDENSVFMQKTELTRTDIIPSIKSVQNGTGEFKFSKEVSIKADPAFENESKLLAERLKTNYECKISDLGTTKIVLTKADTNFDSKNNEHYLIEMNNGEITIKGKTAHAIFNGTQTLLSIIGENSLPTAISNTKISDYPDLSYRGIMLDVARNFTKKENVLKTIDMLAMYKINIFHFHITDDEGWRLAIPGLEELTDIGSRRGHTKDELECLFPAYGSGWDFNSTSSLGNGYYTRQDFIDILEYATKRHITVIPEIEFPGHARAAIKAMNVRYKKYIGTNKIKAEEYLLIDFKDTSNYLSAQDYKDNVINVAMPSTYRFIDKVITELDLMYKDAGLKMNVLHVGGDEVPEGSWAGSKICQDFMKKKKMKEVRELKDYFVEQILNITRAKNIQLAGWQEIVLNPHNNAIDERFFKDNVLSYCWNTLPGRGTDEIPYKLANAGFPVVLCNVSNFYFDMAYNRSFSEPGHNWGAHGSEYNSFDMLPYDIYRSIRRELNGQPIEKFADNSKKQVLIPAARKQIKGIQGQLFSETIRNYSMTEYYLLPKMFGLVERAWNVEPTWSLSSEDILYKQALISYNARIANRELPRLAQLGINFRLAQPGIKVVEGKLYANSPIPRAKICYTIDGSEPTINSTEWKQPIESEAKLVKAKVFYFGKESITTLLHVDDNES